MGANPEKKVITFGGGANGFHSHFHPTLSLSYLYLHGRPDLSHHGEPCCPSPPEEWEAPTQFLLCAGGVIWRVGVFFAVPLAVSDAPTP